MMIIYINIALYATCFQLQRPLEPFLVDRLNAEGVDSKEEYARLQSFFSIVQTVGSLATGYYLDSVSVKVGFYASFLASALSYFILSQATTMNILYLSKVPTVLQAGFLCAQLAAAQCTSEGSERMTALGRLTFSYTLGMIVGPALGGWVGAYGDYYFGAKLAVAGSLLSVVLTYFLPSFQGPVSVSSTHTPINKLENPAEHSSIFGVIRKVWLLLSTKVITGVALSMASSAFPLVLKNTFAFNETALGMAMSSLSVVNALANGILLGPFVQFLGGKTLVIITTCLFTMIVFFGLQAVVAMEPCLSILPGAGLYGFMLTSYIITIFQFILSPALTNESTALVAHHEKGTLLGLEHSLFAAARIVTPQIGVSLLIQGGIPLVASAANGLLIGIFILWQVGKSGLTSAAKKSSSDASAHDSREVSHDNGNNLQERKSK